MAKVELKAPIVEEIKATIDGAASVVLVDYLGLTVEQDTNLRRALRAEEITYKVYKNTLIKRAIEGTEFESLSKDLEGQQPSLYLRRMLQLLQELLLSSLRQLTSLILRLVL